MPSHPDRVRRNYPPAERGEARPDSVAEQALLDILAISDRITMRSHDTLRLWEEIGKIRKVLDGALPLAGRGAAPAAGEAQPEKQERQR